MTYLIVYYIHTYCNITWCNIKIVSYDIFKNFQDIFKHLYVFPFPTGQAADHEHVKPHGVEVGGLFWRFLCFYCISTGNFKGFPSLSQVLDLFFLIFVLLKFLYNKDWMLQHKLFLLCLFSYDTFWKWVHLCLKIVMMLSKHTTIYP